MPVETWLIFILGFMIVGSIVALEIKNLLSAIIAVGVVGLGVSVAFLFLQAPDLAVVQFLFEIFAIIILVRAFVGKKYHPEDVTSQKMTLNILTLVVLAGILIFSLDVFNALPAFGNPLMETASYYIKNGAKETGAANIVSSIILDYRAYDTLGEVTVLFTAILGALTILRLKRDPQDEEEEV